ncbi:MAG: phospholipase D-like domain-containing protein, partial [Planctomycetota bacterium]
MYPVFFVLHLLAGCLATLHLLLHYRRASTAVAWLFAFWILPVVGPFLYASLGPVVEPRGIRRRRARARVLRGPGRGGALAACDYPASLHDPTLARLVESVAAFPLVAGNETRILPSGDAAFEAMLAAIAAARSEIGLATYILGPGRIAERLKEALVERARAGVAVKLLYDRLGSIRLPGSYVDELERGGVRVAGFLKPNPFKGRLQINFRNHRKILVVDGEIAFTGSLNWSDEYS